MKTVGIRDNFKCAILEKGFPFADLITLFKAQKIFYHDPNNFLADQDDRKVIIDAQNEEGPELYRSDFFNSERREFILHKDNCKIVGHASLQINETLREAWFLIGYIHSSERGQRLADLFYKARENSQCTKINMWIHSENLASRKAAERNGFKFHKLNGMSYMVYEKTL